MKSNIIRGIINIIQNPKLELREYSQSRNRINNVGESLEEYIKDVFANTLDTKDETLRNERISECFSYLGNQNNPPDIILRDGDAIEVKKIESKGASLALNSSYPKAKLFKNSPMLSNSCQNCEDWDVKDIIYTVGIVNDSKLESLCMVYGMDYAADAETYEKIKNVIKDGVESIPNVEFAETKELGRINRVDPLGITYMRVRGMWGIENPFTVFDYLFKRDFNKKFNFMAIINLDKYKKLDFTEELEHLSADIYFVLKDVKIKNPNNPSVLVDAKLITFQI